MCNMDEVWRGSLLYLHTPNFPNYSNVSGCGCSINVHWAVELEIIVPNFDTKELHDPSVQCEQVFAIQSGGMGSLICSENHVRDYQPIDREFHQDVHFRLENNHGEMYRFYAAIQGECSQIVQFSL